MASSRSYSASPPRYFETELLHRELDGRERVLDLVGQAPRHLLPGRELLHVDQARAGLTELRDHAIEGPPQVVELVGAAGRDPDGEVALPDPQRGVPQRRDPSGGAPGDDQPEHGREREHRDQRDAEAPEDARQHEGEYPVEVVLLLGRVAQREEVRVDVA